MYFPMQLSRSGRILVRVMRASSSSNFLHFSLSSLKNASDFGYLKPFECRFPTKEARSVRMEYYSGAVYYATGSEGSYNVEWYD